MGRFLDNGDGTVTDAQTGLMWQKEDDGTVRTYADGLSYCRQLRLAGQSDWRLPTLQELLSIVVRGTSANVDKSFTNAKRERYWTITEFSQYRNGTYMGDQNLRSLTRGSTPRKSNCKSNDIAYTVDFADGGETTYFKVYEYYVRAVRGLQSPSEAHLANSAPTRIQQTQKMGFLNSLFRWDRRSTGFRDMYHAYILMRTVGRIYVKLIDIIACQRLKEILLTEIPEHPDPLLLSAFSKLDKKLAAALEDARALMRAATDRGFKHAAVSERMKEHLSTTYKHILPMWGADFLKEVYRSRGPFIRNVGVPKDLLYFYPHDITRLFNQIAEPPTQEGARILLRCLRREVFGEEAMQLLSEAVKQLKNEKAAGSRALAELVGDLLACRSLEICVALSIAKELEPTSELISAIKAVQSAPQIVQGMPGTFSPEIAGQERIGWTDWGHERVTRSAKEALEVLSAKA